MFNKSQTPGPNAALIAALADFDSKFVTAPRAASACSAWRHEFEKEIADLQAGHAAAKKVLETATTRDAVERYVKSVEGLRREESLRYALSRIPTKAATDLARSETARVGLKAGGLSILLAKIKKHADAAGDTGASWKTQSFGHGLEFNIRAAEKFAREYCAKLTAPAA